MRPYQSVTSSGISNELSTINKSASIPKLKVLAWFLVFSPCNLVAKWGFGAWWVLGYIQRCMLILFAKVKKVAIKIEYGQYLSLYLTYKLYFRGKPYIFMGKESNGNTK